MSDRAAPLRRFSEPGDAIVTREPVIEISRYRGFARVNHWITAISLILLVISGLKNAQAKKLDGNVLDGDGVLSLADVGGGSITFEGHGGATVDAIFTASGVQIWLV